jgi:hypothetical protein
MRPLRLLLVASATGLMLSALAPSALAAQIARLNVSLNPERLGQPTTIAFSFRVSSTSGSPSALTNAGVLLPAEMGIATSGLGLENCTPFKLEEDGPEGCPSNSRMGRGTATAQVPVGGETVSESAQVELFSAPVVDGHLAVLVFADARSPVSAQLVFPATVLPAATPFGENINTNVPLVPSLPGGPDVAVTRIHATLGTAPGPGRFVYHKLVHGKRVSYSPRGLILPPSCPRGGFAFKAELSFQDQTSATAQATVPCPHRTRPAQNHGHASPAARPA